MLGSGRHFTKLVRTLVAYERPSVFYFFFNLISILSKHRCVYKVYKTAVDIRFRRHIPRLLYRRLIEIYNKNNY